jgi:hypothetical protein
MTDSVRPDSARAMVLQLLAEGENIDFSEGGPPKALANGDQYLDLEQLHLGVQRARAGVVLGAHALARKSIHEDTWRRLVRRLAALAQSS